MRSARGYAILLLLGGCGVGAASCEREQRNFHVAAPAADAPETVPVGTPVRSGGTGSGATAATPPVNLSRVVIEPFAILDPGNAQAQSEGQTLYESFNCVGCHAHGGGGIGPPLLDNKWFYGSKPADVYQSIVEGRPNGMPSFRGRIVDYQVWEIVAYVRSLSGHANPNASSGREDHMRTTLPPNSTPPTTPRVVPEPRTKPAAAHVTGQIPSPATAPTEAPP